MKDVTVSGKLVKFCKDLLAACGVPKAMGTGTGPQYVSQGIREFV